MDPVERALAYVRSRSAGEPVPLHRRVTLNVHPDVMLSGVTVIELLAGDGVYRSQFETGISNGGLKVISCIEQSGNVAALLHPMAEETKARVSIKPVRLRKASVFLPGSVPHSVR